MSIYKEPYSILEEHFDIPLTHGGTANVDLVIKTENHEVEIEIADVGFRKTDGTGTEVQLEVCFFELSVPTTGGIAPTSDIVTANLDRARNRDSIGLTLLSGATIDETNSLRLFRRGGIATKDTLLYQSVSGVKYKLKTNAEYLLRSTVLVGANNTSESLFSGIARLIKE